MGLETFTLNDFSGGINAVDDPQDLDPNELAFGGTNDVEIVGKGARIRVRNGMKRKSGGGPAPTVDQSRVRHMMPYRASGVSLDNIVLSTALGQILTWNRVTQAVNSIFGATGTPGAPDRTWYFEQAADVSNVQNVWCMNGLDTARKFPVTTGVVANWGGTPPAGTFCKVWKNMMIVAGVPAQPQRLYFSTIANPESWPANNFIDIKSTDDEDDSITALETIGENLLVFKQNSVWVVFDPVTFENRRIADTGCVNQFAHCRQGDLVYWMAPTGVFSTDEDEVNRESKNIDVVWNNPQGGGNVTLKNARMASTADRIFVMPSTSYMWAMRTDLTRPDKQHPWFYYQERFFYANALCSGNFNDPGQGQPESLMVCVTDSGFSEQTLFEWGAKWGANDDAWNIAFGGTLIASFASKRLAFVGTENWERIRRINVFGISEGSNMAINLLDDAGNGVFSQYVNTGNGDDYGYARVRPEVRARGVQLWVNFLQGEPTTGNNPMEITEVEFKYRGGKEH